METRAGFEESPAGHGLGRTREGRDGACYDRKLTGERE
jgi:hypothetical protein